MVTFSIDDREKKNHKNGYTLVYVPEHPKNFDNGWYYEHRIVLEQHLNRPLRDWETIHHINGDKNDNRLINLFICTYEQHSKAHFILTNK